MKHVYKLLLTFLLISPLAALAQGDVLFFSVSPEGVTGLDTTSTDSLLNDIFVIFIVVAIILAVIRLMICGIQYMVSESISSKASAKSCIQYVIWGLLLALASFIILQVVNSDITSSSFDDITDNIDVGDTSEVRPGMTLDMLNLDGEELPSEKTKVVYAFVVQKVCGGIGTVRKSYETRSQCRTELNNYLSIPRYDSVSGCEDVGGGWSFQYRDVCGGGITRSGSSFTAFGCRSDARSILSPDNNPLYREVDTTTFLDFLACERFEETID